MLFWLKTLLSHPLVRGVDIDSPEVNSIRRRLIREKPFLKNLYEEWYTEISNALPVAPSGPVLEIGSGSGFLNEYVSTLITSEILHDPTVDIFLDGHDLPFKAASLKAIIMVDVFHHLSRAGSFLEAAAGCVKPGGVIVMLEPWHTQWSRFVYRYLHHEPFDHECDQWDFKEGGPLSQANSALPWIVFSRDREKFEREYPDWCIQKIRLHTPFRYIVSGGVSLISFSPKRLYKVWRKIEQIMNPWVNAWAMFATIVLVKKGK